MLSMVVFSHIHQEGTRRIPCLLAGLIAGLVAGLAASGPLRADEETALPSWERETIAHVAARLMERAEQGDAETQNRLGNMYYHGDGVPRNLERAIHWFRQAAEQGHAPGQFNLARLYREGKGVGQDYSKAAYWYRKAAEQGLVMAQFFLGKSYAIGQGVPKDPMLAYRWLDRAAIQGDTDAQWARDHLVKTMSPQQLAKVAPKATAKPVQSAAAETETSVSRPRRKAPGDGLRLRFVQTTSGHPTPKAGLETKSAPLSRKDVRALQSELRARGFAPGPIDGAAGPKTRASVKKFQKSLDLEPDGQISQELLDTLYATPRKRTE